MGNEVSGPRAAPTDNVIEVDFRTGQRQSPRAGGGAAASPASSASPNTAARPLAHGAGRQSPTDVPFAGKPVPPAPTGGAVPVLRAVRPAGGVPAPHQAGRRTPPTALVSALQGARAQAWPMLRGLAVMAASSLAAALTVTADLMQLSAALARTGGASPFVVTRALSLVFAALGLQSAFGALTGAVAIAGLAGTALAPSGSRSARVAQLLTQLAVGTMLSPFWFVGVQGELGVATPALGLALACSVGLQALLRRLDRRPVLGPLARIGVAAVLTSLAPLGAGIAMGLGAVHCTLSAATGLALGLLTSAAFVWARYLPGTDDRSLKLAEQSRVPNARHARLALPGATGGTVFADDPELQELAQALLARQRHGKSCEALVLLHGPSGTGKTEVARALANLGDWQLHRAPVAQLIDAEEPQTIVVPWFEQLKRLARRDGRTQVVLLDEAEVLLRSPTTEEGQAQAGERALSLSGALAHELSLAQFAGSNIVLVVATNHPEGLASKVRQRFGDGRLFAVVPFTAPSAQQLGQMVADKCTALHGRYRGLAAVRPFRPEPALLAEFGAVLVRAGTVGREVSAAVAGALESANATLGCAAQPPSQAQFDAFVRRHLRRAWRLAD